MPRQGDSVCRPNGLWQKGNMSDVTRHELTFLPPLTARLARAVARPRAVAAACVLALTALGWLYLGVIYARHADLFAALCKPTAASGEVLALLLPMWSAMALAMMVPSASATILTYAEIADTAARKQIEVVSPVVIVAGYVAVWLGFALAASLAQLTLARAGWLDPNAGKAGAYISGALFVLAGGYQFTTLKHACLRQCRNPFQFFFSNWQTTVRGVFRLGLKQGLFCLGCCWAAMLLMFALGVMNVVWMALLAVAMTIEKLVNVPRLSYAYGVVLIAVGLFLTVGVSLG
jgi:predicted metal-binding membrane protein